MARLSLPIALLAAIATSVAGQTVVAPSLGFFTISTAIPTDDGSASTFEQFKANGGNFWAGGTKATDSSCSATCCPDGTTTSFFSDANSLNDGGASPLAALYLNTETASQAKTQKVFLNKDGVFAYTAPGGEVPDDALTAEFVYQPEETRTDYGALKINGRDVIGCKDTQSGSYLLKTIETGAYVPDGCVSGGSVTRPEWWGISAEQYDGGI